MLTACVSQFADCFAQPVLSHVTYHCDKNGEFESKVIEKRQTRTDEIEQKIMSMYAKGISSQRDIKDTLKEIYGTGISHGLILRLTDKILPEVNEWQNRPLETIYPIVFFDGIVLNSRKDNKIVTKCMYSVLGIDYEKALPRESLIIYLRQPFCQLLKRSFIGLYA